jgi:predicted secreted Zn-dependent protease
MDDGIGRGHHVMARILKTKYSYYDFHPSTIADFAAASSNASSGSFVP